MSRLLIVDDDESGRYLSRVLFEANGYEVRLACHGADALEMALAEPPDLIITDILMPVMDGFALCREWMSHEQLKKIPFVFYTATYRDPTAEELGLSLGAIRFIVKPIEPEQLVEVIRQILDQRGGHSPTPSSVSPEDELSILQKYARAVVGKLEDKLSQLEQSNSSLQEEVERRRRAEEELAERERYFRSMIHSLEEDIMVIDKDQRVVDVNRSTLKSTGRSREDVIGMLCYNFLYGDDAPCDQRGRACFHRQVFETGKAYSYFHVHRREDGSRHHLDILLSPMFDQQGKVQFVVQATRDITDLMKGYKAVDQPK